MKTLVQHGLGEIGRRHAGFVAQAFQADHELVAGAPFGIGQIEVLFSQPEGQIAR